MNTWNCGCSKWMHEEGGYCRALAITETLLELPPELRPIFAAKSEDEQESLTYVPEGQRERLLQLEQKTLELKERFEVVQRTHYQRLEA